MRPRAPSEDVLSDDLSDEELELTDADLACAMNKKVGGGEPHANVNRKSPATGKAAHKDNSRTGMALARQIWAVQEDT